jgi:hypothetical protein
VAFAEGAAFETTLGTIAVEQVLYSREGAEFPAHVQLHSGQLAGLICPRTSHEAHLGERGAWLLTRTAVEGVYTANRPTPVLGLKHEHLKAERPRVRFSSAELDPTSGVVEATVRYENFSPQPVTFPASETSVLMGQGRQPRRIGATLGGVVVPAWRFSEETVYFSLPTSTSGYVELRPSSAERDRGNGCLVDRPQASDSGPPLWLPPEAKTSLTLGFPSLAILLVGAAASLLVLTTRGQSWRWRPRSKKLGALVATGSQSLIPWSVVGLYTVPQLLSGIDAYPLRLLIALGFHALAVAVMWRHVSVDCRRAVAVGALAPLLVLGANFGLTVIWVAVGAG